MKSHKRQFIEKWIHPRFKESDFDLAERELLEAIEKDDGWIKIEEGCEMPLDSEAVLIYQGACELAYYLPSFKEWRWCEGDEIRDPRPTHWRELPAIPKQ